MNYREKFNMQIDEVIAKFIEDRRERTRVIERMIADYIEKHGEKPVDSALEKLADYVLYEEIHDTHPDKMSRNEYPIMSDRQEKTRREREYSLSLAENYDLDGVNRAKPERRHRIAKEERFIDKASRTKNRKRNAVYKRDTSPGHIITYNLRENGGELTEPFVSAKCVSATWRERLSLV